MIENLKIYAKENKVPIIQEEGLKFLLEKIKKLNIKDILELGTAIGYSSINMAKISKDIKIITVERDEAMYHQANRNIQKNLLTSQITTILSDINQFDTNEMFDLIFVDAGKAHYLEYLEKFIKNLKKDGIMIFDNLNFHGMVFNVETIKNRNTRSLVKKINKFYQYVSNDDRYDIVLHREIGDGILVLKRRDYEK